MYNDLNPLFATILSIMPHKTLALKKKKLDPVPMKGIINSIPAQRAAFDIVPVAEEVIWILGWLWGRPV